jgi:hypothetical protein
VIASIRWLGGTSEAVASLVSTQSCGARVYYAGPTSIVSCACARSYGSLAFVGG